MFIFYKFVNFYSKIFELVQMIRTTTSRKWTAVHHQQQSKSENRMTDCFKRRKKQLNFIIPPGARAKINRDVYQQQKKKNRPLLKTTSRSNFSVFLHLLFEINPVAFLFEPSWRAADLSSFHQPAISGRPVEFSRSR